jgi:hypothetical protein
MIEVFEIGNCCFKTIQYVQISPWGVYDKFLSDVYLPDTDQLLMFTAGLPDFSLDKIPK